MSPTTKQEPTRLKTRNAGKKYLLIPAWILVLAIVALGIVKSGNPANLIDPSGFLFVLVGGIALVMISFPVGEIRSALLDAVASPGNEADLGNSAHFWEAAGRSFLIVGVVRSILHLLMFLRSLPTLKTILPQMITMELARYLLTGLYGILLAVICFVPCWKLIGRKQDRPAPTAERKPIPIERSGRRFGAVIGYALFFSLLIWAFPHSTGILIAITPAVLVVLGGTIAIMLFMRRPNSGLTLSTAFAVMGLIGSLLGIIQMNFGLTEAFKGIGQMMGALAFFVASCLTALLGVLLLGAPLEDRVVRTEQVTAPSAFSRAAWYAFPLLILISLAPMIFRLLWPLLGF